MKILHTVEYYTPSIGGAQEVVKQISERLVARGHQVTVATTYHPKRHSRMINGVHIEEFKIEGNSVRGITGEIERYQNFLKHGDFDIMMNYAAQQWATDLVYPILDQIPYKKTLTPCGFSGLYKTDYKDYFAKLPEILRKYDQLIFHANDYRDVNFARQHEIQNLCLIPNGASGEEFSVIDETFRARYGIPSDAIMLLTVGSHTGSKGHALALEALKRLSIDKDIVLVIIGNAAYPVSFLKSIELQFKMWHTNIFPLFKLMQTKGILEFFRRAVYLVKPVFWGGFYAHGCLQDCRMRVNRMNWMKTKKRRALLLIPSATDAVEEHRAEVVAAYHAADLFIFGSNVEYSPLVLFEAMASKTPFLSLACGNAAEIVEWGGGGVIASTIKKNEGFVDGDPVVFARFIDELLADKPRLLLLAETGYKSWLERFTWEKLVVEYESLYRSLL